MLKIPFYKSYKIGKFRECVEVHYQVYDRYSLSMLLKEVGFVNIKVMSAFESNIPNWVDYNLDTQNGEVLKPDSLFIEGQKI